MAIDACYMPLYSMMNDVEFVLEKMEEKNEKRKFSECFMWNDKITINIVKLFLSSFKVDT